MNKILTSVLGGSAAVLGIALLSFGESMNPGWKLLMAPFGATAVLLFAAPQSPFSKPLNVVGGHVLTATVGLIFGAYVDFGMWTIAVATGSAIALMVLTNTLHPPAGANPMLIIQSQQGWGFLLEPVLLGAMGLVFVAKVFEKLRVYFRQTANVFSFAKSGETNESK